MAVRQNRFYHDPNIGAAFSNLAAAFAPPDAQDVAAYTVANAKREEAARLAELFNYAKDPSFNQSQFDRLGVAAGRYAPTQSYYAVDTNDATNRRGQDISARTSITNNAADNARALREREMIEAAATGRNSADNTRAAITALFGPLSQGQVRPSVPAEIAGKVGLPELAGVAGAPKPLSETEVAAQDRERLRTGGLLTDEMILDSILGERAPVQTVGPDGNPVFSTPGAAARTGARAYVNPGATAKPTNAVAVTPDGTRIPAVQDLSTGRWRHAQTGAELPPDIQIMDLPRLQGSATDVGGATVANQTQANNQEAEVTRALNLLDIYENTINNNPGAIGLAGLIRGTAQNAAATVQDLAASFGKQAPEVAEAATTIQNGLRGVAPEFFDPAIAEADFLQGTLAYALARTENPSGEVSRQAFDRALERVKGGGLLANTQSAKSAIATNRRVLQSQLEGIRTLRNPGTGRTDTGFRPPPDGADKPRLRYNPATGDFE